MRLLNACLVVVTFGCPAQAQQGSGTPGTPYVPVERQPRSASEGRNDLIFRNSAALGRRAIGSICTGCGVSETAPVSTVPRDAPADRRARNLTAADQLGPPHSR